MGDAFIAKVTFSGEMVGIAVVEVAVGGVVTGTVVCLAVAPCGAVQPATRTAPRSRQQARRKEGVMCSNEIQ